MGAPFDNLVSFINCHFDPTARQGCDACIHLNVWDFQVYNLLHKDHRLMFEGAVLVNCIALCWGPFASNDNNAKTVIKANIVEDMHDISNQLGVDYSYFADSAYPQSWYIVAILKCPQEGCSQLSSAACSMPSWLGSTYQLIICSWRSTSDVQHCK